MIVIIVNKLTVDLEITPAAIKIRVIVTEEIDLIFPIIKSKSKLTKFLDILIAS